MLRQVKACKGITDEQHLKMDFDQSSVQRLGCEKYCTTGDKTCMGRSQY